MKYLKCITSSSEIEDTPYEVAYLDTESDEVNLQVQFVDLGIVNADGEKVLWATRNMGAREPWENGKYYQWGDTVGYYSGETSTDENTAQYHSYWKTCPFNNGSENYDATYWTSVSGDVSTTKGILKPQYDAVTVAYGEGYRIATQKEYELFWRNVDTTLTKYNGVGVAIYTSMTDRTKKIICPLNGYMDEGTRRTLWSSGPSLWMSKFSISSPSEGDCIFTGTWSVEPRYYGMGIRAVRIIEP